MKGIKFLVTGACGYIGSALVTELVMRGADVTAVDNLTFGFRPIAHLLSKRNFRFVFGDVRDSRVIEPLARSADVIIPLAAIVGAPKCMQNPILAKEVNEDSIKSLARLSSLSQKILFCNTNAGYGVGYSLDVYDESSPLNPSSVYGVTKKAGETALLDKGNAVSFRLGSVFGSSYRERPDLLLHFFVKQAVTSGMIEVYEPHYRRNFIHLQDVVASLIFGFERFESMGGSVYNVVLGNENISKLELAQLISEGTQCSVVEVEGQPDPDQRDYIVSSTKLENEGFLPSYSIFDGVSEMCVYYQNCKNEPTNAL